MNLKPVSEILPNTKVIIRLDTDLPIENGQILDNSRLIKSLPTLKLLLDKNCKLLIIGHRGRPQGIDNNLSLKQAYVELMALLEKGQNIYDSVFIDDLNDAKKIDLALAENNMVFLENLRFWPGEQNNDPKFLENLISLVDVFVNDAFAVAHRKQASIMLHHKLPAFYGINFIAEANAISKLIVNPDRPLTIILGGAKEDKLKYLPELEKIADQILIGGKLPKLIDQEILKRVQDDKIRVAELDESGFDLSQNDIEKFKEIILQSRTIIWAGAMGMYESEDDRNGTEEIAKAVAESNAYKVIAGGDTTASIVNLGLKDRIDFICSGGGVILEFLTKDTLPAWE
ncbi:MAG: phosphoglycerate kinase [Candidatus Shapirobacteria bacterium]|nr:phosphoglycerate kinase [Candidatus Shapirobacteria bacterium]